MNTKSRDGPSRGRLGRLVALDKEKPCRCQRIRKQAGVSHGSTLTTAWKRQPLWSRWGCDGCRGSHNNHQNMGFTAPDDASHGQHGHWPSKKWSQDHKSSGGIRAGSGLPSSGGSQPLSRSACVNMPVMGLMVPDETALAKNPAASGSHGTP